MKYLLVFGLVLLVACQSEVHLGCQEGEIVDGECVPAEENNVGLFGQDLDMYVDSYPVEEPLGFLATPKEEGTYPGVVMIHEWWGLNDNIKEMAKILAKEGYVVFAVDLYEMFNKSKSEFPCQNSFFAFVNHKVILE